MRNHARLPRSLITAAVTSLALATGCFTPPALLPVQDADLAAVSSSYPKETETIGLNVEPGVTLRGVFVPSDPGAPVVVHLLESAGSCASRRLHFGFLTRQLSDLGFASLVVDYAGVGASSGEPSVANLERDVLAIWREALHRAGDEKRVWVRATSIGSIGAALLLKNGARPARIVLVAPVLADSATQRFAHAFHGPVPGFFASLVFRDIADVDLISELRKAAVPTFVMTAQDDEFLTPAEHNRIEAALGNEDSHVVAHSGGHIQLCVEAHALLVDEWPVFASVCTPVAIEARVAHILSSLPASVATKFAAGSSARERLTQLSAVQRCSDPISIAAAALVIPRAEIGKRVLWLAAERPYQMLDFDELCEVLSLEDPGGELPIDLVEQASKLSDLAARHGGKFTFLSAESIAAMSRVRSKSAHHIRVSAVTRVGRAEAAAVFEFDGDALWRELLARGRSVDDASRQFMRILLRAERIPDRVRRREDGRIDVEIKNFKGWRVLEPTASRGGAFTFSVQSRSAR